jgi:maltose/moltooligosaccharide transporter
MQLVVGFITNENTIPVCLISILNDLYKMPKTMKQLAVVQFFSWFALFAMWIYTTPAVTHHIYGATDPSSGLYNQGAKWVGVLMAVYNGFAAVMAFALVAMAKKTNRKTVHMISLIIGGLAFASFYVIKNPNMLFLSELGIGLAWA